MATPKPVEWLEQSWLWSLKKFLISLYQWSKCLMKVITILFNIFENSIHVGHGIFKALFWNVQRNSNSMCFLMKCIWKLSISISSCAFRMSWIAILWGRPCTIHYLKKLSACAGENVICSSVDLGSVKSGHKEVCDFAIVVLVKKGQGSSKLVDLPFRDILEVLSHKRLAKMLCCFYLASIICLF